MQDSNKPLIIPVNKPKVILLLLGCVCFVACSIWMWESADMQNKYSPLLMKLIAGTGIAFFGVAFIFGITFILSKKYGLIIDDNGITDNSTIFKARYIPWYEITGLGEMRVKSTRILLLRVRDPQAFIDRETSWKRKLLLQSYRSYGTPLSLTANLLKIDTGTLSEMINERIECSQDELQ